MNSGLHTVKGTTGLQTRSERHALYAGWRLGAGNAPLPVQSFNATGTSVGAIAPVLTMTWPCDRTQSQPQADCLSEFAARQADGRKLIRS
jgi:hypothetical protein